MPSRARGTIVVAIQLALALGVLAPAASGKQERSHDGERSHANGRSYADDRSYAGGRSEDHRGWAGRRGADDRDRGSSHDRRNDGRGSSGDSGRRSWRSRDDARGLPGADDRSSGNDRSSGRNRSRGSNQSRGSNRSRGSDRPSDSDRSRGSNRPSSSNRSGGSDRSSDRAVESAEADRGASALQPPGRTAVGGQSVGPAPSAVAPESTAAPQTQAPTGDAGAGGSEPGRRGDDRGDRASRRDGAGRRARSRSDRAADRGREAFAGPALAPLALLPAAAIASRPAAGGDAAGPRQRRGSDEASTGPASPVVRTVRDIVETVPGWMKWAIAALAALSLLLAGGYALSALRARRLARQRAELLGEVGLLQAALLPAVPDELTDIGATVAYAPADGPGAGGDFYDVLPLAEGRTGFVLGDLSGHGREAIERTAFMRYTLRAYLEAGLEPAAALHVAGRVIGDDLDGDFATVLLAVHDPRDSSLTFASAGHPPPIVVGGGEPFEPVLAGGSPPLGIGEQTGMRQTTVPLASDSVACLHTDGLTEARTADGLLGEQRLAQILAGLGPDATARQLLDAVAAEAVATPDDMATCLLSPKPSVRTGGFRTERLELAADELDGPLLERFLAQCDVPDDQRAQAVAEAHEAARRSGGALVSVVFGSRRAVDILPRNVAQLDAASRRAA